MEEESFRTENGFLLVQSDGCSVYQFRNDTGDGTMTCYEVFPGAMLSFNDFHVAHFDSAYVPGRNMFVIDHCREGKMEYLAAENAYAYVGAGDIKMDRRLTHMGRFIFPSSHYHGLTIAFDMEIAASALSKEVKDFPIDLTALQQKYCPGRYPHVIREMGAAEHIFGELYQVPGKIRIPYFKIKIMELLLYLDALELPKEQKERPYYYKTQIEKVSFVSQDNFLFRCSLLENIRLGNPSATDEEVKAAARAAQCEEFILKLPDGYDTVLGEGGDTLSGGQKQRISIAHRLATIEQADQILVVDDGRIAECGTHKELIKQNGKYRQFVSIREKAEGWKIS